mmetsp:Transcript_15756/g.26816  ORF Transcript_15756/g.26816 Transcript_15756/m.26816 type:complete len:154 (+) Transcript_15756:122-583(+)
MRSNRRAAANMPPLVPAARRTDELIRTGAPPTPCGGLDLPEGALLRAAEAMSLRSSRLLGRTEVSTRQRSWARAPPSPAPAPTGARPPSSSLVGCAGAACLARAASWLASDIVSDITRCLGSFVELLAPAVTALSAAVHPWPTTPERERDSGV